MIVEKLKSYFTNLNNNQAYGSIKLIKGKIAK